MHRSGSDADLLAMAARHLGTDAETLLRRYYGSPDDVRHELDELDRTGRLQPSLARLLRLELGVVLSSRRVAPRYAPTAEWGRPVAAAVSFGLGRPVGQGRVPQHARR